MRSFLILALMLAATAASAGPSVKVWQAKDPAITEGETTLDGEAADIYAMCLDYTRWTQVFPDIESVIVTKHEGVDARVTLVAPGGHRDNLQFHNQPGARMIYFEDTGNSHAEVWAELVFAPGDAEHTTKVHLRLYANVKGVASLIVSDTSVRQQREQKVQRQLAHVHAYFARTASRAAR